MGMRHDHHEMWAEFVAAAQMPETDCPACGTPLRYARAVCVTEGA